MYWGQTAVTSIVTILQAKVESASFGGRKAILALAGGALQTAPAFPTPVGILNCDLPVESQKKMTMQFRHTPNTLTPVTSNAILIGIFDG